MTKSTCMLLGLSLALVSMSAVAQTVTGSGTTNTVPVFTGTSTVGNSPITVSGSNVGIGTTSPAGTLDVEGGTAAASTNGLGIKVVAQNAGSGGNNNGGNITLTTGTGVGTGVGGNLLLNLGLDGGGTNYGFLDLQTAGGLNLFMVPLLNSYSNIPAQWAGISMSAQTAGAYPFTGNGNLVISGRNSASPLRDIVFATNNGTALTNNMVIQGGTGKVGIGTTSPAALLSVGPTSQFQVSSSGALSTSGGLTVSGGTISLPSGSVANSALQGNGTLSVAAGTGLSGGGTVALGSATTLSLSNTGTAGTYGSATQVPVITTDAFGRVTSVSNVLISAPPVNGGAVPQVFSIPDTGGTAQWVKLGTFNGNQQGYDVDVKIVSSSGYNADIAQDQVSYIHFKSSNAVAVNASGFAGDSWWYQTGPNTSAPSQIVWVANAAGTSATAFTLFANFGIFSGTKSYYVVDAPPGTTWTNAALGSQSNPGTNSASVLIAQNQMYVSSVSSFAGNVGIGTTAPAYKLDVAGQVHAAGYVFSDGSTQTTAFIPANCGADYAESVDVSGDRTKYEPGDLLVIDPDAPGKFLKSNQAYSTMVAGVYSTQPGFVGRKHLTSDPASAGEVPMAMVGRVPTKVSAENGPIKVGDLLVPSSTMGYAMKGTDRSQMLGAVIGKALGSLDNGTGIIEVLVTLQ